MNTLAIIRRSAATVSLIAVTLLFLDFTGTVQPLWGWMAKIQFLPAFLALNLIVLAALVIATLVFGRIYCSIVCPLGIMQDILARIGRIGRRNPYSYSAAHSSLQLTVFALFAVAVIADFSLLVGLLAPYSSYGRIVSVSLGPVWHWCNNLLASWAETHGSYAFYRVAANPVALNVAVVSAVTFVTIAILAVRNGRTYCNTICPVGTILGYLSQYSWLKPYIDTDRCNGCGLCARNCKCACIDNKNHKIDYLRCVTCFDCLGKCHRNAIKYGHHVPEKATTDSNPTDTGRRAFLSATAIAGSSLLVKAS
ncbi:MAG: 4Fe-4S binding protein, partial [Muribaculum sp.]|nr:4Fe-4S binding protein [Muribaculum sp.]